MIGGVEPPTGITSITRSVKTISRCLWVRVWCGRSGRWWWAEYCLSWWSLSRDTLLGPQRCGVFRERWRRVDERWKASSIMVPGQSFTTKPQVLDFITGLWRLVTETCSKLKSKEVSIVVNTMTDLVPKAEKEVLHPSQSRSPLSSHRLLFRPKWTP